MSKVFGDFYNKLYNCLCSDPLTQFTQEKFDAFVWSLQLPLICPEQLSSLNTPINAELADMIRLLLSHKAPGPDGLPYSYYKTFLQILAPHMLNLFSSLLKKVLCLNLGFYMHIS